MAQPVVPLDRIRQSAVASRAASGASYHPHLASKDDRRNAAATGPCMLSQLGRTIRSNVSGTSTENGKRRNHDVLHETWCTRIRDSRGLQYEVYEFQRFQFPAQFWLSTPELWNIEHMVVLGGNLGVMNSVVGGIPQVQHAIPKTLQTHHLETFFPAVGRPLPNLHLRALVAKVTRHYLYMRDHYKRMQGGVNRGILEVPVTLTQAKQVVQGIRLVNHRTGILLVGKVITVQDATTGSTFWSADSGPGPKSIQQLVNFMRIGGKASKSGPVEQRTGTKPRMDQGLPFVHLWCMTTGQTNYDLAVVVICLARLLHIIKPHMIGVMSDISSSAIEHLQLKKGELSKEFLSMGQTHRKRPGNRSQDSLDQGSIGRVAEDQGVGIGGVRDHRGASIGRIRNMVVAHWSSEYHRAIVDLFCKIELLCFVSYQIQSLLGCDLRDSLYPEVDSARTMVCRAVDSCA